jgi:RHS repeat-associated protein
LSKAGSGLATGVYSYNPGTHQLIATGSDARSVDANGNTTALTQAGSTYGFGYNQRDRLSVAQLNQNTVATYTYNADNERIAKNLNGTAEGFDYDEDSQLLAEYGATNRDYIWMDGIPVANIDIQGTTSTITYVTADYLGTPRAVADSSGSTLWQLPYQGNPWSEAQPTSNGYVYNFRLPGQYYDAETGWNYNVNRFYEPSSGRYGQADPLGWAGGQWSLYAYVTNTPLMLVDPLGLSGGPGCVARWTVAGATCGGALGWGLGGLGGGVGGGAICTFIAPGPGTIGCGAVGASSGSSAGAAGGALAGGAVGGWIGSKVCGEDDNSRGCSKATPWQLKSAGIDDAHKFKSEWGAVPNSRFDICACKDGSIIIKAVGMCGMSGPGIETVHYWK